MNIKKIVKKIIPQSLINQSRHFPEAVWANLKYGFPSREMMVIGVTGTDGKTTTTNMIFNILRAAGKKVAMISTINAIVGDKVYDTGFHVTSPKSIVIQKYLKQARDEGCEYVILEVTSHALDQYRVWGIRFDVGVITNITHEHLDYHKTFENYLNTKSKLIKDARWVVLNEDDKSFKRLTTLTTGKITSFGLTSNADINPKLFPVKLKLLGDYNLSNAMAAVAVAKILEIDEKVIKKSLESFSNLSGRMEEVKNNRGLKIFVDFAHTPNAIEKALLTLRKQIKGGGKLISIFGAASERDIEKRPIMGAISAKSADVTILTDEDPRFESSETIINQIAEGALQESAVIGKNLFMISDRQKAINMAIKLAKRGDVIGVFGKGHEKSMNYRGVEKPWSDIKAVEKALR